MNGQPDSFYLWIFRDTRTGDLWDGVTVQDTGWANLGKTWHSPHGQELGYYEIFSVLDLGFDTPLQEGTTYVAAYGDAQTHTTFPAYYGSQNQPATINGPGTELDYVLINNQLHPFGQGGLYLI